METITINTKDGRKQLKELQETIKVINKGLRDFFNFPYIKDKEQRLYSLKLVLGDIQVGEPLEINIVGKTEQIIKTRP